MRLSWIDYAKVICIYLMVVCHSGLKGLGDNIIYQFHIPAFFIISGYLFRPKGVKKELLSFGIPIFFYGILTLFYRYTRTLIANGFSIAESIEIWQNVTSSALRSLYIASTPSLFQGCWFVIVLWMMRLLMELNSVRQVKPIIAILCFLYCCVEPILNISENMFQYRAYHLLSSLPFFITGMLLKEKHVDILRGNFEIKLILFLIFFAITLVQGRVDLYKYHYGVSYALMYTNAAIGTYLLFNVSKLMPVRGWVEMLSTGTLLILGVHGILFHLMNDGLSLIGINNVYLSVFVGLAVLFLCFYPIKWLNNKYPSLLGKIH